MYSLFRVNGKLAAIVRKNDDGSETSFDQKQNGWNDFLDWNAKQPVPLDLSDKPPDPILVDMEHEQLVALFEKADGDIGPAEFKLGATKILRRLLSRGALK